MTHPGHGLARNSDPATSHAAAAAVDLDPRRVTIKYAVLAVLNGAPDAQQGVTHDQLIALYRKYQPRLGWPRASDSGIRTRCRELVREGLVEQVPDTLGKSRYNRGAILWRATPPKPREAGE